MLCENISEISLLMMKFLLISLLVLSLSLAEDPIQKAIRMHGEHVNTVLTMIEDGRSINHILRPFSFLGSGSAAFVFRGKRLGDDTPVAIKFFNANSAYRAEREYEMYSYLNAINNSKVENYGIATVYYYGHWNDLIVMAYTELGQTLADLESSVEFQNYDILLVIQQFIKQSKYIHSRGVRHDYIKLKNIRTRGYGSFLVDFEFASKMSEDNGEASYFYASLNFHQDVKRVATDDWESFLYVICKMAGIRLEWFTRDVLEETGNDEKATLKLCAELKSNRKKILEAIDQSKSKIVKPIIHAFADEAFSEKQMPDYDGIDKLVTGALKKYFPIVQCFSWAQQITDGLIINNLSDLVIPSDFSEYEKFNYPEVNEKFFKMDGAIQKAIRWHGRHVNTVLKIAKNGKLINGILRPMSFLSSGSAGFIFKGMRLRVNASLSIKFFSANSADEGKREYEMYSYLNAINNTEVEKYGIPTVYYYGPWKSLIVIAYTELGKTLADHAYDDGFDKCDFLHLIKQFMKQSKYIHSRGVRHDNIKPENILTRGCQSFLVDFDLASKMAEDNGGTTEFYASLNYHREVNRVAIDDWESFLYVICEIADIRLDWFDRDLLKETGNDEGAAAKLFAELKSNRQGILKSIDQSEQGVHNLIIPIIRAFAGEVFSGKRIPDYDGMDQLVTDALGKYFPEKKCFSWFAKQIGDGTVDDKSLSPEKIEESIERANTDLSDLVIPNQFSEYKDFNYPNVNEEFFNYRINDLWDVDRFRASKFR